MNKICLVLWLPLLMACASAGDLDADKKLNASLESLGAVYVQIKPSEPELKNLAAQFEARAIEGLKGSYQCPVSRKPAKATEGALIKIEITDYYEGIWLFRAMPFLGFLYPPNKTGETLIYTRGSIVNLKTGQTLTTFELDTSSKDWRGYTGGGLVGRTIAASVGNGVKERTDRAIRAAVDEILVFLKQP